jgi:hypothetical protein
VYGNLAVYREEIVGKLPLIRVNRSMSPTPQEKIQHLKLEKKWENKLFWCSY